MRRWSRSRLLFAAILLAGPVLGQGFSRNGWHEDTRNGFKLKIPDNWESVPCAVDEKWIVAKYLAEHAVTIKKGEYTGTEAKPQLRIIVFSDEARKMKPAEVRTEPQPAEGTIRAALNNGEIPYKDYKDYIKRNAHDGGFFFYKETEAMVGDMPCWQYEIKFEKLTVPKHVVTWVFRGDAADYAVEFEVLEDHWEKLLPVFTASLQSFRFIKRDAANVVGWSPTSTAIEKLRTYPGIFTLLARSDQAIVLITTDKGELFAELPPLVFLEREHVALTSQDHVTVKGYEQIRDGRRILLASELTAKDGHVVRLRDANLKPLWATWTSPPSAAKERLDYDFDRDEYRAKFDRSSTDAEIIKRAVEKCLHDARFETKPPSWDEFNRLLTLKRETRRAVLLKCDRYEYVCIAARIESGRRDHLYLFLTAEGTVRRRECDPESDPIPFEDLLQTVIAPTVKAIEAEIVRSKPLSAESLPSGPGLAPRD